jgi:hypothetical protein
MQKIVREKLDKIDELFPPERLALSRDRWTRLWHGQPPTDRYPFVYGPYMLEYYDAGFRPEERLQVMLDQCIFRGQFQDDFIPGFFPGCNQSTIPSMFGAEEIVVNGDHTCHRIISKAADIAHLPAPSIAPGTVAHNWLELQQYVLDATEGRLPIHVTDMQGPADVCGQLWGYESFFASAYEDPDSYHTLMSLATDAFIQLWTSQMELLGDAFVGTHLFGWSWVPPGIGATLSADSLTMVSPAFYKEFYQPYIELIGKHFNGLAIHSCGNFSAVIPWICATDTVKAVNAGQMTISELCDAGLTGKTMCIAYQDIDLVEDTVALIRSRGLRLELSICGLWPAVDGIGKPLQEWTPDEWANVRRAEEWILAAMTELASRPNT